MTALTNASGAVTDRYEYDAFGNTTVVPVSAVSTASAEPNAAVTATSNPFRYCGEYWDSETGTYYLRARYYNPALGRFTQQDAHWSPANRVYGDSPQRACEYEDRLGLNLYSYAPQLSAIRQSGNLYVYCVNNPVLYRDPTGEVIANIIGAVLEAGGGALLSTMVADHYGLSGWKRVAVIASFTTGGALLGWFAGPLVEKAALTIAAKMGIVTASTTAKITQNLIENAGNLNYSKTVLGHLSERAYTYSTQIIRMIMESATPIKDLSLSNGLKWVVPGSYNGASGVWELVINTETNTIVHYLFRSAK